MKYYTNKNNKSVIKTCKKLIFLYLYKSPKKKLEYKKAKCKKKKGYLCDTLKQPLYIGDEGE